MHPRHLAPLGSGLVALGALLGPVLPGTASAQPSPLPTGGPAGGEEEPKPEGIAEQAPKAAGLLTTTPTLPPPRDRRKKFEVVTIDGYLRTRGDWLKNLNLGFSDVASVGGAPFGGATTCSLPSAAQSCDDSIKSANMRLRFEPSVQLSETIAIHSQIDLFDNYVLGPETTGNSPDTVTAKRAWAEVSTALGFLKFGRMPDHFGLGMVWNSGRRANTDYASWETLWQPSNLANVGGNNPVDYALDAEGGSTVDRVMFTAMVPGTPLRAAAALDWGGQFAAAVDGSEQPRDLDDRDDRAGWMLSFARIDAPSDFDDRVARGKLAINYAARVQRSTLDYRYVEGDATNPVVAIAMNQKSYTAAGWVKLAWRKILFEAEGAVELGSIDNPIPLGRAESLDILTAGGVARISSKAVDDKLGFGIEVGAARGDSRENDVQGRTSVRDISYLPADSADTITRFRFNPEYHVDLILFRELLGQVSNAAYARPWLSYELTRSIKFTGQNVTAGAFRPVATPGNSTMWGLEFDADLAYRGNGFTAGMAYGAFFPLAAMNHPSGITDENNNSVFDVNSGDAGNAHRFQLRLAVEF